MKDRTALLSGLITILVLFILLVLTLVTPFSFIIIWTLPIPLMYLTARQGWRSGSAGLAAALIFLIILNLSVYIFLPLFMVLMGAVMGYFIYLKKSAFAVLLAGSLGNIAVLILYLAVAVLLFHYNPVNAGIAYMNHQFSEYIQELQSMPGQLSRETLNYYKSTIKDLTYIVPSLIAMVSFFYALIVELIGLPVLRLLKIDVPRWVPFRNWHLPKSIVWIYLITLLVLVTPSGIVKGSSLYNIAVNFQYILQILLAVQGFSFLYFFARKRRLPIIVPVLLSVTGLFLLETIEILGIIDLGFDLRKRIKERV